MADAIVTGFEPVARGLYLEGLAVDYERDVVWYSDVITGGVHRLAADGRAQVLNPGRMWTGGVMMNADGAVLSSGPGGIMWNHPDSGRSGWLLHEIDGRVINGINEMMPDGTGGIYFGTNDIDSIIAGQTTKPTALYRLTRDRQVIQLADGIGFTNGVMLSPDRKRFYCNDTFVSTFAFDVAPDLTLSNKQLFVQKEDCDGMALDAEGNLWITGFRSSAITRVAPDGSPLDPVPTPGGAITQVRFGGADLRDLYVNTVPGDAGDTLKDGGKPSEPNSVMYRARSAIPGMAIAPAQFDLG
jgi:sugar lactone lactonase YvrE